MKRIRSSRRLPSAWGMLLAVALASPALARASSAPTTDESPWRYTVERPGEGWMNADYEPAGWHEGFGGFGTHDTPGARVGTVWATRDIWLRRAFTLEAVPPRAALLVHHDEDAEVFLNGRRVAVLKGYLTKYEVVPLAGDDRSALRAGENLIAVHCRQTGGGQFIDVHVIDADHVPKLPPPKRDPTPFRSELITRWGEQVTADNVWAEHPRPALVRPGWQNLNGRWDYAITPAEQTELPVEWAGKVLVPFAIESRLSGVRRLLEGNEALWYRRTFDAPRRPDRQAMLNFEAVDYRCEVTVNGKLVGRHIGGSNPFSFDVTAAIHDGANELVVRVEDETEGSQLRGKQVLNARGIWYTQVSGIWQTVWLEEVPAAYIQDLKIRTDAAAGSISVRPVVNGSKPGDLQCRVVVREGNRVVGEVTGGLAEVTVPVQSPKLWSPQSPHLYDVDVAIVDARGGVVDRVGSYAGIRSVGKMRDSAGHVRFTLNGEPIFHWGTLDQGWWPDGLLTPPSDEAMVSDIEFLKAAGFNMIRKHIKVEPRRYYYHCDRLGMMVWQDQVSGGAKPAWTRLQPDPADAKWSDADHAQFMAEFERMVDALENHPSIVVWTPFNEAWGQHRTMEVGRWIAHRDPTRLVNIASGGNFWPVGDIVDAHNYPHPDFPFDPERYADYIKVIGEFGGHGYPVPGHLWDPARRNWGYGGLPENKEEYRARYVKSLEMLDDFRRRGIAAGVYTQTTDVEGEVNGLVTYDRKVVKIPAAELAKLHERLFK